MERLKRLLWPLGLLFLGLSWIWFGLSSEKLERFLTYHILERLPAGHKVEVGEVSTGFFGVDVESVTLTDPKGIQYVSLSAIEVSLYPWDLVLGKVGVEVDLYEGHCTATLGLSSVEFEVEGLLYNFNPAIRKLGVIVGNPKLSATGELALVEGGIEGLVEVHSEGLSLDPNAIIDMGLPKPLVKEIKATLTAKGERVEISLIAPGDLNAKLTGAISKFNPTNPMYSQIDLLASSVLDKAYEKKMGSLSNLLFIYRNDQGEIQVKLTGNLNRPKIESL